MRQKTFAGGLALQKNMKNTLLLAALCLLSACDYIRGNNGVSDNAAVSGPADAAPSSARAEVFRDTLKDGGEGPAMVVLPTGRFWMGDSAGDGSGYARPVRLVTMARSIAMGKYEITFAEYERFAAATGLERPNDEGWGRDNRPVITVIQEDARAYAAWLSEQTGKRYRLPTEAEWEYAARALTSVTDTSTRYSWGDDIVCSQARYGRREGGECSDSWDGTVPVGSFEANAFGLYDMHGNVSEWVADCWHDSYEGAPTNGSAWTTGCDDEERAIVRGGAWNIDPRYLRCAYRDRYVPSVPYINVGFRLVQDLNP